MTGYGQNRCVTPHGIRALGNAGAVPFGCGAGQVIADQQGTAAFAEIVGFARLVFAAAQGALQVRHMVVDNHIVAGQGLGGCHAEI